MKFSKTAAAIYGTAVGDALGVPFQFKDRDDRKIILLLIWLVMVHIA